MTAEDQRAERLATLSAIEAALDDPIRLLRIVAEAEDDEDAVRKVAEAYRVDQSLARALTDLQFGALHRAARARLSEALRVLRADWGPPVEARLVLTGSRRAVLTVDGAEHRFAARGRYGLLDAVVTYLRAEVAIPRLRPVLVTVSGGTGATPVGMTVRPDGSASFDHDEDD